MATPTEGPRHSAHIADDAAPELLELLFNSTSDGVFAVDRRRRIIAYNQAAEQILGVPREQALGRPCWEVFRSRICEEGCLVRQALATGVPTVNLAAEVQDAHDHNIPVTISSSILHDADGKILGGVETFRNMNWIRNLVQETEHHHPFVGIVTNDGQMKHIYAILPTIAASESCILLHGETGTGKSLIARAIHRLSPRREGPLITVNCGALPETLLESEIFGYRAGAFTGAVRDRKGRIAAAEGGTLFLDEIGDMPLSMQVKLLRFLQDHVYEPLGDDRPVTADVRVIAATHRDLTAMVDEGRFRSDLYYRINVLNLELPPLRERRRDIPLLAQAFLDRLCRQRRKQLCGLSAAALAVVMEHDYPGNIRELENVIEHAYVLCPGPEIDVSHLPDYLTAGSATRAETPLRTFADIEAHFLREVLERNDWNRARAAAELGIHKTTLLRRIRRLEIDLPAIDGRSSRGRRGR